jgi:uncharacterized OsmC-like protein
MTATHNVRVDAAAATAERARSDPSAAQLAVDLSGEWRTDAAQAQFGGRVKFPKGETVLEADFPPFLSGEGRAPSPLLYCFYGALSCYASTYAMQAAIAGVPIERLTARLRLTVDFRAALGVADVPPLDAFRFELEVTSPASDEELERIRALADARCPAIWAMDHQVPHESAVRRAG